MQDFKGISIDWLEYFIPVRNLILALECIAPKVDVIPVFRVSAPDMFERGDIAALHYRA